MQVWIKSDQVTAAPAAREYELVANDLTQRLADGAIVHEVAYTIRATLDAGDSLGKFGLRQRYYQHVATDDLSTLTTFWKSRMSIRDAMIEVAYLQAVGYADAKYGRRR